MWRAANFNTRGIISFLDLTVSQITVTLLLFVFLEYSYIIMYEYASIIHNYQFIMLITMIHVFYKLLEIYHNILFFYLLYIELQNCSVNIKRVNNNILSYNNQGDVCTQKFFYCKVEGGGIIYNTPPNASTLYKIITDCKEYLSVFRNVKLAKLW